MSKVNVEKWFEYERSDKLENQAKYYIASTIEGYLNGCYNDEYEPMTKDEWKEYVWNSIELDKGSYINGNEAGHLYFFGKEKTLKLVETYLDNYADVQNYIK